MNDYSKLLDYFKESFGLIDYFHFNSETTQNVYSGNLHIENGKIIEEGTHEELMRANGKYASMYQLQASLYEKEEN